MALRVQFLFLLDVLRRSCIAHSMTSMGFYRTNEDCILTFQLVIVERAAESTRNPVARSKKKPHRSRFSSLE